MAVRDGGAARHGGARCGMAVRDGGAGWRCGMAVRDGGAGWRCGMAVSDGGAGWRCRMAVRDGGAGWRLALSRSALGPSRRRRPKMMVAADESWRAQATGGARAQPR
eukprot:2930895-Prymnesium_polylepis.1